MSSETQATSGQERDSEDLARFGYSQELKRSLGLFSSFAVAFSYISPSTGIFTLFATANERSEEHTSELQSRLHLVCRLLLEKKKTQYIHSRSHTTLATRVDC